MSMQHIYLIKTRRYILYECKKFNKYWNPRRDTIVHFALFLQLNPNAFYFSEVTSYLYYI